MGSMSAMPKCQFVIESQGVDACVSQLSLSLPADLAAVCPACVKVYFENVGGKIFEAALPLFNKAARVTICGLVAHYDDEDGGVYRRAVLMRRSDLRARIVALNT